MGNSLILPDEISEPTRATIVVSAEAMEYMEKVRKEEEAKIDDDYPVDKFAGKGFFEKPQDEPDVREVQAKANRLLEEYPIAKPSQPACVKEEEIAKRCYQIKEDPLDCSNEVEQYLQCAKSSLLNRLATK